MSGGLTAPDIERLVRGLDASGSIAAIEVEGPGLRLRIALDPSPEAPAQPEPAPVAGTAATIARSPAVGRLRLRHPAGEAPFCPPGATVEAGAILAFVEAGGLLQPVVAPRAGRLGPALEADGAAVDYGRPLFAIG